MIISFYIGSLLSIRYILFVPLSFITIFYLLFSSLPSRFILVLSHILSYCQIDLFISPFLFISIQSTFLITINLFPLFIIHNLVTSPYHSSFLPCLSQILHHSFYLCPSLQNIYVIYLLFLRSKAFSSFPLFITWKSLSLYTNEYPPLSPFYTITLLFSFLPFFFSVFFQLLIISAFRYISSFPWILRPSTNPMRSIYFVRWSRIENLINLLIPLVFPFRPCHLLMKYSNFSFHFLVHLLQLWFFIIR